MIMDVTLTNGVKSPRIQLGTFRLRGTTLQVNQHKISETKREWKGSTTGGVIESEKKLLAELSAEFWLGFRLALEQLFDGSKQSCISKPHWPPSSYTTSNVNYLRLQWETLIKRIGNENWPNVIPGFSFCCSWGRLQRHWHCISIQVCVNYPDDNFIIILITTFWILMITFLDNFVNYADDNLDNFELYFESCHRQWQGQGQYMYT